MEFDLPEGLQHKPHPLTYPDNQWKCPITGVVVPKGFLENLEWRRDQIEKCTADRQYMRAMVTCMSHSPLLFINLLCWTYAPKQICYDGAERNAGDGYMFEGQYYQLPPSDMPFITWPAQDAAIETTLAMYKDGGVVVWDKSRAQGATWLVMAFSFWLMVAKQGQTCLVGSRKQPLVDGSDAALMGKLDYMYKRLPEIFFPESAKKRVQNLFHNSATHGTVQGESANEDIFQGMRGNFLVLDEAARFPYQRKMMRSAQSVATLTALVSTPSGPGTVHSGMVQKAILGTPGVRMVQLGYWDHPMGGHGRVLKKDEDGAITGKKGSYYWWTRYFEKECQKSETIRDIRENLLISHDVSGLMVLDAVKLGEMRKTTRPARIRAGLGSNDNFVETSRGHLHIWDDRAQVIKGEVVIDTQHDRFVIGGDFSSGVDSSNTVLSVYSILKQREVAQWTSPSSAPHEVAEVAYALGHLFKGSDTCALMIWEQNGPGASFGKEMMNMNYSRIYYSKNETVRGAKGGKRFGWWSTGTSKEILFSDLNKAVLGGTFDTRCEGGVDDMMSWTFDEKGRIVSGVTRDLSSGAAARHGDRAIAYGLCVKGAAEINLIYPMEDVYVQNQLGYIDGHMEALENERPRMIDPYK